MNETERLSKLRHDLSNPLSALLAETQLLLAQRVADRSGDAVQSQGDRGPRHPDALHAAGDLAARLPLAR